MPRSLTAFALQSSCYKEYSAFVGPSTSNKCNKKKTIPIYVTILRFFYKIILATLSCWLTVFWVSLGGLSILTKRSFKLGFSFWISQINFIKVPSVKSSKLIRTAGRFPWVLKLPVKAQLYQRGENPIIEKWLLSKLSRLKKKNASTLLLY